MNTPVKKKKLIMWQLPMKRVLYALAPLVLASVYFFGWYSALLLVVVNLAGFLAEYLFLRQYKEPVSSAVFVSATIFGLTLPPAIPLWIAVVGIVFGIIFGKMVFGGFGRNVFNPAMVGRAFIYVSFAGFLTSGWMAPVKGVFGGLTQYSADIISKATPMVTMAKGGDVPLLNMLLGNTSGSIGETSAVLILLCGIYLLWKKVANYRIVLSCTLGMAAMQAALWLGGVAGAVDPLRAIVSGGFMFGVFFVATDPISASRTDSGRWIYGALIGIVTVLIRQFAAWPEGFMFAILLANMFVPIVDYGIKELQKKRAALEA